MTTPRPCKNSRRKGQLFERAVAADLREALDPPELVAALRGATTRNGLPELLKRSRVRRGEQAHGACEPDIVVGGLDVWLELQHAAPNAVTPEKKLRQAERDVEASGRGWLPIAVTKASSGPGARQTTATLRLWALRELTGRVSSSNAEDKWRNVVVAVGYPDLLRMLAAWDEDCYAPTPDLSLAAAERLRDGGGW